MCRMSHTDMVCLSGQGVGILRDAVGFFERCKKTFTGYEGGYRELKFRPMIIELV